MDLNNQEGKLVGMSYPPKIGLYIWFSKTTLKSRPWLLFCSPQFHSVVSSFWSQDDCQHLPEQLLACSRPEPDALVSVPGAELAFVKVQTVCEWRGLRELRKEGVFMADERNLVPTTPPKCVKNNLNTSSKNAAYVVNVRIYESQFVLFVMRLSDFI